MEGNLQSNRDQHMTRTLHRIVPFIAALATLVVAVDVSPFGWDLPPDAFLAVVGVACVAAYALIARHNARPIDEVYRAGIDVGRRRALAEVEAANVTCLPERRLRVVESARAGHP